MMTWQVIAVVTWYAICAVTVSTCITGHPRRYYRTLDAAWDQVMRPSRWIEGSIAARKATRGQDS